MIKKSLSYDTLSVFFHDISLMIASGAPMDEILAFLKDDCTDEDFEPVLTEMLASVSSGNTLADAMADSKAFPDYALSMVVAAEHSGKLEGATDALGLYYSQRAETERLITASLKRPMFMLLVIAVLMGAFMLSILPSISGLYKSLGGDASLYISGAYVIGGISFGLVLLALLAALIVWAVSKFSATGRGLNYIWNHSFLTKETALTFAKAQFVSDLDVRLSGGGLLDYAFEEAAKNVTHPELKEVAKRCADRVFAGDSLGMVLREENLLPPICTHIMFSSLQSGDAEAAFQKVRGMLFQMAEDKTENLIERIEPMLTGFFTVTVGLSFMSVMLPLIGVISAMG